MHALTLAGRRFFAVAAVGSGVMQLVNASFVRLVPALPTWIPWHSGLAMLTGGVLVLIGFAILLDRKRRPAALVLGATLVLVFLLLALPVALSNPLAGFMWTNPAKTLALAGGAFLIASASGMRGSPASSSKRSLLIATALLAVFLIICGVQHFFYAGFVDTLVPAWIPPGSRFWTYFTGVALIAGGVGLLLRGTVRAAALLSAAMVFLWVLLLHIPRALSEANQASELAGVFEALAISGVALLIAGSSPRGSATAGPSV
ncbi:MAG TPA: hypothetical protein VMM36_20105 [Opitutaceae bacterium]|nr:hypothetical protein [Opitutaceae bacterium]